MDAGCLVGDLVEGTGLPCLVTGGGRSGPCRGDWDGSNCIDQEEACEMNHLKQMVGDTIVSPSRVGLVRLAVGVVDTIVAPWGFDSFLRNNQLREEAEDRPVCRETNSVLTLVVLDLQMKVEEDTVVATWLDYMNYTDHFSRLVIVLGP